MEKMPYFSIVISAPVNEGLSESQARTTAFERIKGMFYRIITIMIACSFSLWILFISHPSQLGTLSQLGIRLISQ